MSDVFEPVSFLQSLIAFPSVSSISNLGVNEAIAAILDRLGFSITFCNYNDNAGVTKSNLIATRLPRMNQPQQGGVAYFCHTDVVPADDWSGPGEAFCSSIQDGRIYGRGSCDMKGSLVAMLTAISRMKGEAQSTPIHVICTGDEEVGFVGARHLVASSPEYRQLVHSQPLAIIGEPTNCDVVHAHKGIFGFRIISRGRAAHSSTRDGLNANLAMVPIINELVRLYQLAESDPTLQDDRFDPPTLSWNFGFSDYSKASNIVPARSEAWVSLRTMPTINGEKLVAEAETKAEELGLEFRREKGGGPVWIDPNLPSIRAMCEVADCSAPKTVCYGTDGGEFTELKQMVVCGPGDIAQAHTADEYLSLSQLQRGIEIYAGVLKRWCVAK